MKWAVRVHLYEPPGQSLRARAQVMRALVVLRASAYVEWRMLDGWRSGRWQ